MAVKYLLALLPILALTACESNTCELSCERVFVTCGFDYPPAGENIGAKTDACIEACRTALDEPSREDEAVQWMSCVNEYACEGLPAEEVYYSLPASCPPDDYYVGNLLN